MTRFTTPAPGNPHRIMPDRDEFEGLGITAIEREYQGMSALEFERWNRERLGKRESLEKWAARVWPDWEIADERAVRREQGSAPPPRRQDRPEFKSLKGAIAEFATKHRRAKCSE